MGVGVITGTVTLTGVGLLLASPLPSGGYLLIISLLVALISIVLGMGILPTTCIYCC